MIPIVRAAKVSPLEFARDLIGEDGMCKLCGIEATAAHFISPMHLRRVFALE